MRPVFVGRGALEKENNMEWSFEGQMEVAQAISNQWGAWMRANGVQEVVVEVEGVGTVRL